MQPPFTECTRSIINQAQSEARELNQEFVGTEHLALSLLKVQGCDAVRILRQHDINHEMARSALLAIMPRAAQSPVISGDLPLSPKAQRAIHSAIVNAQSMQHPRISTRALALALIDDDASPFVSALRSAGADVDALRQALKHSTENSEG